MSYYEIANIIYNMQLDMDYADYSDFYHDNINELAEEIRKIKEIFPCIFYSLESIATDNEDSLDRFAPIEQ